MLDLTHVKIDSQGLDLLHKVGDEVNLKEKIQAMFKGEIINKTEKRQVWHVKLREFDAEDDMHKEIHNVR